MRVLEDGRVMSAKEFVAAATLIDVIRDRTTYCQT